MSVEDKNKVKDKYKNLSEEDKNKRREYGKNRYHNMSEEKKQKLKEYQKKYQEKKSLNIIMNEMLLTNYSPLSISNSVSLLESLTDSLLSKSSLI